MGKHCSTFTFLNEYIHTTVHTFEIGQEFAFSLLGQNDACNVYTVETKLTCCCNHSVLQFFS